MPELCEVQIMTENLESWCLGQTLSGMTSHDSKFEDLPLSLMQNSPVDRVWRRAKYSVVEAGDYAMILHYRMTGQIAQISSETRFVRLQFSVGDHTIGFVDPRRFGTIDIIPKLDVSGWFDSKNLGKEIWPEQHSGDWWKSQMHSIRTPIKVALLRQDRVVGIGNILASELCFAAELSPFVPANELTDSDWVRLADGAYQRIVAILEEERGEKIGFLHEGANNPQAFQIYGRQGEECPKCQMAIVKCTQANRATYYCLSCQALPDS